MNKISSLFYLSAAILILSACASDKAIYRGQTVNGSPHGVGKKFWPDGSKYDGQWANGQMSGKGLLSFQDSRRYDGGFENDKLHGQGKMQYPDGSSYEGAWANGERSGQGLMKFADQSQYSGNWSSNAQSGFGTQEYRNGNSYSGNFIAGQRHGDGAAVAYYHGAADNWCIDNCSQTSAQFAIVSGGFVNGNAESVTAAPCGTSQDKCKNMLAPTLAVIAKERARKLALAQRERERLAAEDQRERERLAAEAEKARQRKEAALLAAQQRKEEARLALLNTGTASQVYMHADKLEAESDYVQASEAYRIVVSRFPESSFAAASMTRLGAMRDKRDQQAAEQKRLALEAEQRKNEEAKRQSAAAERQAEREAAAAQRLADQNAAANQQRKASSGAACVELAKAVCDQTTSGFANSICKAGAGIGCN
jgi:hypothetical protein